MGQLLPGFLEKRYIKNPSYATITHKRMIYSSPNILRGSWAVSRGSFLERLELPIPKTIVTEKAMVMKLDKLLCHMFLLAILALTVYKLQ